LKTWAEAELKRIEAIELKEESKMDEWKRELDRMERLYNAPTMGLDGKIIGGKSLSERERAKP
ncbi:unnamed protein product, partial [marine sediment metagenome]